MILWTIQTAGAWRRFRTEGVLTGNRRYVDPCFLQAYEWLARQMSNRLGPQPEADIFPIWAWYQWQGQRKKPDLRSRGYLPKGERGVRIELKVPDHLVLLSDFDLWHYVLNYWYLPRSLAEGEQFEAELAGKGLSFYASKPLPDINYHRKIVESWQRIFDLDWHEEEITGSMDQKSIQATLWEIRLSDVWDVRPFRAR